jgi:hypothetical protein
MHPDALKMPEEVDYDIMVDILKSSEANPFSLDQIYSSLYVNNYLAFPNPL